MRGVKRIVHGLETWKACIVHRKGNEVDYVDQKYEMDQAIPDLGSDANVLLKQTWEHMGRMHGQTHTTMVSYPITDGKLTKYLAYGEIARSHSGHRRCEHTNRF